MLLVDELKGKKADELQVKTIRDIDALQKSARLLSLCL